jgi:hypothetical protein
MASITKILESPIAQFTIGLGVFYGVQKFFKEVEEKLNADAKVEIWMWLAEPHAADAVRRWPDTFTRTFDVVFGTRHLSWRCFSRSCIASAVLATAFYIFPSPAIRFDRWYQWALFPLQLLLLNALPDYVSLLETRSVLRWMSRSKSRLVWLFGILIDLWATLYIASVPAVLIILSESSAWDRQQLLGWKLLWAMPILGLFDTPQNRFVVFPAFFTTAWVWLYALSGYAIIAARRLDAVVRWMNRRLDVEAKPLQAVGLIAAVLSTLVYWVAVIMSARFG